MTDERPRRLLIAGLPRSGTTWAAYAIAAAPGVLYVHEPDNEDSEPLARRALPDTSEMPRLDPGAAAPPAYGALWDLAYAGRLLGRRPRSSALAMRLPRLAPHLGPVIDPGTTVVAVKSVRLVFALEWVAERTGARILVVRRNPLNMLAGWARLGWGPYQLENDARLEGRLRPEGVWPCPAEGTTERAMWALCALTVVEHDSVARHPEWHSITHESLCENPPERFAELFAALALPWSEEVADYLRAANAEGKGWEVRRVAEQEVEGWRRTLTPEQIEVALPLLHRFAAGAPEAFAGMTVPDLDDARSPRSHSST